MLRSITLGGRASKTSALGYGTAGLLRQGSTAERLNILASAYDAGMRHFDTAPIYGLGESERALGRFARNRRSAVTIATKFGLGLNPLGASLSRVQSMIRRLIALSPAMRKAIRHRASLLYRAPVFSPAQARASLESSLRRLGTDYVDVLLLHECSAASGVTPELLLCLQRLRQEGRIRAFGIATRFEEARAFQPSYPDLCEVVQFDSDAINSNASRFGNCDTCSWLITHSALRPAHALLRTEEGLVRRWSQILGLDLTDSAVLTNLLIRAALKENRDGTLLIDTGSVHHLQDNVRAAQQSLDEALLTRFAELLLERFGAASREQRSSETQVSAPSSVGST